MNCRSVSRSFLAVFLASTLLGTAGCALGTSDHSDVTVADLLNRNLPDIDAVKALIDNGQLEAARNDLQQLRAKQPENLEVAFLLGEVSLRLHDPAAALGNYEAAAALPEKRSVALQGAGIALLQLGRADEAATKLQ